MSSLSILKVLNSIHSQCNTINNQKEKQDNSKTSKKQTTFRQEIYHKENHRKQSNANVENVKDKLA